MQICIYIHVYAQIHMHVYMYIRICIHVRIDSKSHQNRTSWIVQKGHETRLLLRLAKIRTSQSSAVISTCKLRRKVNFERSIAVRMPSVKASWEEYCGVLQCVAACCSMLQFHAVCCNALQMCLYR